MRNDLLTDTRLEKSRVYFERACRASRAHSEKAREACDKYGDHGSQISGCVRDHFPDDVKDTLRILARLVTDCSNAAREARPPRIRHDTIRALGRAVARRDGSGFYGPQA